MNGVDTSDQMRSYYNFNRPIRRGSWQAIAWNFLLEVVVINTFFLQLWGQPEWRREKSQYEWRRLLSSQLIQTYGPLSKARQKARPRRASDRRNDVVPWQRHLRGSRKVSSPCVACSQVSQIKERTALGRISGNSFTRRTRRKYSRMGCIECDVAICNSEDCWYNFHTQNI